MWSKKGRLALTLSRNLTHQPEKWDGWSCLFYSKSGIHQKRYISILSLLAEDLTVQDNDPYPANTTAGATIQYLQTSPSISNEPEASTRAEDVVHLIS